MSTHTGQQHPWLRVTYDRGTLACFTNHRLLALEQRLPALVWDPKLPGYHSCASDYHRIRTVAGALGLRLDDRLATERPSGFRPGRLITVTATATTSSSSSPSSSQPPTLRPYQQAALRAWEHNHHHGILILPTGSGKTHVAMAAIARAGRSTLILVPTRLLVGQWRQMLRRWYQGSIGVFGDGERTLAPITVATFASAWRHMARELGARFDLLIVDEAHHLGSAGRQELLLMCAAPWRLGLTATPPVGEAADRLVTALGPIRFELRVAQLQGTYLARVQVVRLGVELTAGERTEYDEARQEFTELYGRFCGAGVRLRFGDFVGAVGHSRDGRRAVHAWHRARKVLSFPLGKERALAALLEQHRRDHRILVFTADRQSAFTIARRFLIMPITSDIGRRERERALAAFEAGRIRALVSPRVLNEGLDVPTADVGIVVGGALGAREYAQRVGRLLRTAEGKEVAVIYHLVVRDTVEATRGLDLAV